MQENALFCSKCGTPVSAQPVERKQTVGQSRGPFSPSILIAVLVIVVIIVAFVIALPFLFGGVLPFSRVVGSGNLQTQDRSVSDFTRVDVSSGFKVQITQSNTYKVSVTADDNVLNYTQTTVSGNVLTVRLQPGVSFQTSTLKAVIAMPTLEGVMLSGGTNITASGFSSSNDFTADLSGGSYLKITGRAGDLEAVCSGGSTIEMSGFPVNNTSVDFSGGSKGTINLSGRLDATLSGGSRLYYLGNPTLGDTNTSGDSAISRTDNIT